MSPSGKKAENEELPPSYDKVVKIDIDNPSAPLLHQTFPGSIFGTSTIVTFELSGSSYPVNYSSFGEYPTRRDYSFVIRDYVDSVQAKGNVSNCNITLKNISGTEVLQIRSCDSSELSTNSPNLIERLSSLIFKREHETIVRTYEVFENSTPIGLIKYSEKEPAETCLKIHGRNGNTDIVVKALELGDFSMYRDHLSLTPLCNVQIPKAYASSEHMGDLAFKGKIIFHQETGITKEEQLLCTAAAIAIKVALTDLCITKQADERFLFFFGIMVVIVFLVIMTTVMLMWGD